MTCLKGSVRSVFALVLCALMSLGCGDASDPEGGSGGAAGSAGEGGAGGEGGAAGLGGAGGTGGVDPIDLCADVDCDDQNACTSDACDPLAGSCFQTAVEDGANCQFGVIDGECSMGTCTAASVTATVCADGCGFTEIQAAIEAASYGDVVLVKAGLYPENINFLGKEISVVSEVGAASTVIDGDGSGSVVTFDTLETRGAVLQGFTVANGFASDGGGILVESSSPVIAENVVVDNVACSGAGISIRFSSPLVVRNQILGNRKGGCSGGTGGGGVYIGGAALAEVIDNIIADNTSSSGGGIAMFAAGDPTIRGNEIRRNVATDEGGGLSLFNRSDALIKQNLIYENMAPEGGGIYMLVPASGREVRMVNNTIVDNGSAQGSGLFSIGFHDEVQVINNVIVGKPGQTAVVCDDLYLSEHPIFSHNDVFSEGAAAYGGACDDQTGTNSNISLDPQFVSAENENFDLSPGSPAIDSGDTSLIDLPSNDILGRPRPVDGDGNDIADADMGAFEYQGEAP